MSPREAESLPWQSLSLVIWQAPRPSATCMARLESFLTDGGIVVFFPPGKPANVSARATLAMSPLSMKWPAVDKARSGKPYRVSIWDEQEGPLANTDDGLTLPLATLSFSHRQVPEFRADTGSDDPQSNSANDWRVMARFSDGKPFLMRRRVGNGSIVVCTSLPRSDWSDLGNGYVLVPMMQRLLAQGSGRLSGVEAASCGDWRPALDDGPCTSITAPGAGDFRWHAGVYRSGSKVIALNRPLHEDVPAALEQEQTEALFGELEVDIVEKPVAGSSDRLQSELWRLFIFLCLACMLGESYLLLSTYVARRQLV